MTEMSHSRQSLKDTDLEEKMNRGGGTQAENRMSKSFGKSSHTDVYDPARRGFRSS